MMMFGCVEAVDWRDVLQAWMCEIRRQWKTSAQVSSLLMWCVWCGLHGRHVMWGQFDDGMPVGDLVGPRWVVGRTC